MNNKHQELIAEKVAEVCNKIKLDYLLKADSLLRGMCLDKELRIVLNKTLQDTMDTVLKEERERTLEILTTTINANQMLRGWERYWKEVEPNRFVENCIECENTSRILKALDKTPPNKV